jgi:AcrR family transcriptional regulator
MGKAKRASERRDEGLSLERIVEVAIELLDAEGEDGLTFRALATRLATGSGAIYWHVANKSELLVAASNAIVAREMKALGTRAAPRKAIRNIAVSLYEGIDAHPWVGAQLFRAPSETAMLQIFERIGREIQAMGVSRRAQFTSVSALVSYIIGVSVQNAANGRQHDPRMSRAEFLKTIAARWEALDPDEYPFTRKVAAQMREHNDRAEFLAGVDLILNGIALGC